MTTLARLLIGPTIGLALLLDRVAYRRQLRIALYETPTVFPTPSAERDRPPSLGGGAAAGPVETPAAASAPSSPPPAGAGPSPPGRPHRRGRHASGRVLWFPWAKPMLEVTA